MMQQPSQRCDTGGDMYRHLSFVGASQSDGLVPSEDVESGAAVLGWSIMPDGVCVYVGWVPSDCDDPVAYLQAAAGGQYILSLLVP